MIGVDGAAFPFPSRGRTVPRSAGVAARSSDPRARRPPRTRGGATAIVLAAATALLASFPGCRTPSSDGRGDADPTDRDAHSPGVHPPAVCADPCAAEDADAGGGTRATADDTTLAVDASAASPADPWPDLPRSAAEAEALVAARTARPTTGTTDADLSADALLAILSDPSRRESLVAGHAPVVRRIQAFLDGAAEEGRDAYVLWGTHHDARLQVEAFRRLVGPGGLRGLTLIVLEQFSASGEWRGVAADVRRGDDDAVAAWMDRGDPPSWAALADRHHARDQAAWKHGYEADVLELLPIARAGGVAFAGCDMPAAVQELTSLPPLDPARLRVRLRELHCALSLARFPSPRRVAMLWGSDHVRADGFPRFLPPTAAVLSVHLFGGRPGEFTAERELRPRLVVLDPLLVPLDDEGREVALLLPDDVLGGEVDRSRDDLPEATRAGPPLTLSASAPARATIGDRVVAVGPEDVGVDLPPGDHLLVVETGELRFVGAVGVRPGVRTRMRFDAAERYVHEIDLILGLARIRPGDRHDGYSAAGSTGWTPS